MKKITTTVEHIKFLNFSIIHKSFLNCLPFTAMQDLHLLSNERWTRASMLGLSDIPSEATAILAIPLQNSTEVSDIRLFICPHKKNQGVYVKYLVV